MTQTFHNPVQIISGDGSIKKTQDLITPGKWLIITSKSFTTNSTITSIIQNFSNNTRFLVHDEVSSNPELSTLISINNKFKKNSIDGILAIGGGSVLDTAKILSVTLPSIYQNPLSEDLIENRNQVWTKKIPLIVIPTTSGTGAEVTPFATLWEKSKNKKFSVYGQLIYANTAILDPLLTLSLPLQETFYSGLDATSHALESIWNKNSSPLSKIFAWKSLDIISDTLPKLIKDLNNIEHRRNMQFASMLAGLAISQTKTAVAHSISYSFTNKYDIPHGLACSFTLPYLIKENYFELCKENKSIITKTLQMLESLDLKKEMKKYIKEINLEFSSLEINKSRLGNYKKEINIPLIIKNSL